MYLPDRELIKRIDELAIEPEDSSQPFQADEQIGPASIDLRVSGVYWKPQSRLRWRSRRTIDISQTHTMELRQTYGWRRVFLKPTDKIRLRPGEIVLARTFERFQIPSDCAGAIEGRSSFARMGLSVHATGGFINPGWSGQMPLTLHNQGPFILKLPVGIPICQLMLVKLTDAPERDYQARADRKYKNDYGGPSVWWRDGMIQKILSSNRSANLHKKVFDELDELLDRGLISDDALVRLDQFIAAQRVGDVDSSDDLLDRFSKREGRSDYVARGFRWGLPGLALVMAPFNIAGFSNGVGLPDFVGIVATLTAFAASALVHVRAQSDFLTPDELDRIRR